MPVASVKQIMDGIVGPAAGVVFDSVEHHRDGGRHGEQVSTH